MVSVLEFDRRCPHLTNRNAAANEHEVSQGYDLKFESA